MDEAAAGARPAAADGDGVAGRTAAAARRLGQVRLATVDSVN